MPEKRSASGRPAPEPFALHLDGIAHGGEAVGRLAGKAVFVPHAIPGETVLVRAVEDRGRFARARLLEVLEPSPDRCAPACPHFGPGLCGGCHWQHIAYARQLNLKGRIVREQLERIGGLAGAPVRPAVGIGEPWGYRNNVQLLAGPGGSLAYQEAGTNRPVTISRCPIAHPLLAGMVSTASAAGAPGPWRLPAFLSGSGVRQVMLRAGIATNQPLMIVAAGGPVRPPGRGAGEYGLALDEPAGPRVLRGRPYLEERLGGRTFRYSPQSFFQVNTAQAERLVELVAGYAALAGGETVLDTFCGVGVFGLLLAERARRVTGIEESPGAVADARANAAGMANVSTLQGRAEIVMAGLEGPVDVAVVDPPRQGCDPAVLAALVRLAPARIVYVSCDPATLARDLAALARGGYDLREVTPVDMFPQTYHIETVSLLCRRP